MAKLLNPKIIELEGLAMAGKVKKATLESCVEKNVPSDWRRIVAILDDDSIYKTGCMEPEAAKRNYMVLSLYIRNWGKLVSFEE